MAHLFAKPAHRYVPNVVTKGEGGEDAWEEGSQANADELARVWEGHWGACPPDEEAAMGRGGEVGDELRMEDGFAVPPLPTLDARYWARVGEILPRRLARAAASFKANTSLGVDRVRPRHLNLLSSVGFAAYARLMVSC